MKTITILTAAYILSGLVLALSVATNVSDVVMIAFNSMMLSGLLVACFLGHNSVTLQQ